MIRARPSNLRAIGRTTRFQCVRQQFDPILTPEYFAVQHIGRRSEYVSRQRILTILFVFLADLLRQGLLHQRLARKAALVGQSNQRRGIRQIEFVFPNAWKGAAQEWIGIVTGLDRGNHETVRQPRIQGPMLRLEMKIQTALVAPALQFEHAVTLSHRVTLDERQAPGFREQIDQHDRLVVDLEAVGSHDLPEQCVPDIGPGRGKRKVVVDLARHEVSQEGCFGIWLSMDDPNTLRVANVKSTPSAAARRFPMRIYSWSGSDLLQCGDYAIRVSRDKTNIQVISNR